MLAFCINVRSFYSEHQCYSWFIYAEDGMDKVDDKDLRAGERRGPDRRKAADPNFTGPDRRSGERRNGERRTPID